MWNSWWERRGKAKFSYFTDVLRIYRILPVLLRRGFWRIMALQAFMAFLESSTIIVMSFFIMAVGSPDSLRHGLVYRAVSDFLPVTWSSWLEGDRTFLVAMCFVLLGFIILKNTIICFTMHRTTRFSEILGLYISWKTYNRYFCRDYYWHLSPESGVVLGRLGNRFSLTAMATALLQFFGNLFCSVFMIVSLFLYNPGLTTLLSVVYGTVSALTYGAIKRKIDRAGQELADISGKEGWAAGMASRGIREIIIYRKQEVFLDRIVQAIREAVPRKAFLSFSGMLPSLSLEISGFATIFGVMLHMSYAGRPMHEIIGMMSMLFLTAWRLLPAVSRSMGLTVHIRGLRQRALNCLELLEGFSCTEKDDKIEPDPNFHFSKNIEVLEAGFRYPNSSDDCLHNMNIRIEKGECVGLVGASGSGKSTLAMLLVGLLTPSSGEILVDGDTLTPERREAYRARVGFVPQNPLILPGSIADNVALAQWGETYDRDRVGAVCRLAAMDFLSDDPRGMDFPIGDGGQGLSGGQAQRVSIARALFGNPEILVFDEATSSLDLASEGIIEETVMSLRGNTTIVVIAHRLSSIEKCDRIIWLDKGKIVDSGVPEDILPRYTSQLQRAGMPEGTHNGPGGE